MGIGNTALPSLLPLLSLNCHGTMGPKFGRCQEPGPCPASAAPSAASAVGNEGRDQLKTPLSALPLQVPAAWGSLGSSGSVGIPAHSEQGHRDTRDRNCPKHHPEPPTPLSGTASTHQPRVTANFLLSLFVPCPLVPLPTDFLTTLGGTMQPQSIFSSGYLQPRRDEG